MGLWMRSLAAALLLSGPVVMAQNSSQPSPNPSGGVTAGGAPVRPLSPAQEAQALAIGSTIRCPVCQGLPITESPVELSQQMMRELRAQVVAGRSADQITSYFAARYGDSVRLDPPRRGMNLLLWLGPVAAALMGGGWLLGNLRARGRLARAHGADEQGADELNDELDDEPDAYLAQVQAQLKAEVGHRRTP